MVVTTGLNVEGKQVVEYLGVVWTHRTKRPFGGYTLAECSDLAPRSDVLSQKS